MTNELERVLKATVVAYLKLCPVICLEVLRETSKTVVRESDVRANIWTGPKGSVRLASVRLLPVR